MSGEVVAIGIDVGGTKLTAATVDARGRVLDRRRRETPTGDAAQLLDVLSELVRDLDAPGRPVGIGVAGIVAPDGTLRYGPNLDVEDVPLGPVLSEELETPIVVKNDATAALYGEYRAGAGRGAEHVLMMTLGTGVGGAFLVDGRVVDGAYGFAGEVGHIIIVENGRPCPCGNLGCLEAYASGTAIGLRASQRLGDRSIASALRDVPAGELVGKSVTEAASDGDDFAQEVLAEAGAWLGVGVASLVNVLDPERIVVGGGAAINSATWVLPAARAAMAERVIGADHRTLPEVVLAELADDAGMVGAALLAAETAG